jgi:cytochrome c oxidase subunit IV
MTQLTPRTYALVFVALILLTGTTVGLSFIDLGQWHASVGMVIAAAKALLVVLFFMHVWYGPRLNWLFVLSGLFWLGILLALTMSDYVSRG